MSVAPLNYCEWFLIHCFYFFKFVLSKREKIKNEMNSDIEDMGLILVESTFRHRKEVERLEETLLKDRRVKYFNTLNDITADLQGTLKVFKAYFIKITDYHRGWTTGRSFSVYITYTAVAVAKSSARITNLF